jgi:hypothetical protein
MTAVEVLEHERNRIISELISQCDCTSLQTQCENKIIALDDILSKVYYKEIKIHLFPEAAKDRIEQHIYIVSISSNIEFDDKEIRMRFKNKLNSPDHTHIEIVRHDEE